VPTLDDVNHRIPATTPLQLLVTQTAWANRQLFGALRAIPSFVSQNGADLIIRALDHIHVVRSIFQAHLRGELHSFTSTQRAVIPPLEELDRESEAIDGWYVDTVMSLPPEELERARDVRFTDGKVVPMTATAILLHVVTHTIHHRGNIDVIMLLNSMQRTRDGFPEFLVSRASAT
jgi:uncharacterized damage-inducible protein DinB